VPVELRGRLEPAEIFHEILVHRWYLSEAGGRDVGLDVAAGSYVANVLEEAPEERTLATRTGDPQPSESSPTTQPGPNGPEPGGGG
jgi:hypothetical protein